MIDVEQELERLINMPGTDMEKIKAVSDRVKEEIKDPEAALSAIGKAIAKVAGDDTLNRIVYQKCLMDISDSLQKAATVDKEYIGYVAVIDFAARIIGNQDDEATRGTLIDNFNKEYREAREERREKLRKEGK